MRDHIFKAAGDLKLKKLKIGHTPESSSKYPLAEKDLSAEIRARRARGRKIQPGYLENQKSKGQALGWSLLKGGTHWSQPIDQGNGYARMVKRVNINRYFEKTGCLMTVNGQGDEKINPEGLASFKFDRPVIPTVLAETPVQNHVPAVSHAELEEAVHREELSEEEVESEEDEGTDEAEKWFVPEG
ncbi:hypothetical protein CYMTET_27677, partial [Cymbomonas tetramitiformis]